MSRAMSAAMTSPDWIRALASLVLLPLVTLGPLGCLAEVPDDEESVESVDSDADALVSSWKCDIYKLGTDRCQNTLASIRAQAGAAGRSDLLERGISWLEAGVTYNRNGSYQGYRRDCSGFVSMSWQFADNPNTALFPPFVSGKYAVPLGSFDDLAPGDAVNKTYRNPYGHVMLFAGWASQDHSELLFLHHYATGKPVALIQVSRKDLGDFIPIRSIKVGAPAGQGGVPQADPPPPPSGTPPTGCGTLGVNQALDADQAVKSCDGRFTLVQQSDGNLVLYKEGKGALWSTGTYGGPGRVTIMQGDGNLVMYSLAGKPIWASNTAGHPGATLAIQDDGNVVIYAGKAIWWTGTNGK
jgi:hypothetical protein